MEIKLTPEQVNIVIAGLRELPHKFSDDVIREIMIQVQNQTNQGEK